MNNGSLVDILLTTAPCEEPQYSLKVIEPVGTPPMGLLYLASALRAAGFRCKIIDANHLGFSSEELAKIILDINPPVVACSSVTSTYPALLEAIKIIKNNSEAIRCVIGGPHATARPREIWSTGLFDAIVVGEGEIPLTGLVSYWFSNGEQPPPNIEGLWTDIVAGDSPYFHPILDSLPIPAFDAVNLSTYMHPGTLFTKRGCPRRCYFCAITTSGSERFFSLNRVVDEIEILSAELGIERIDILDDTFLSCKKRTFYIANELAKRCLRWTCQGAVVELLKFGDKLSELVDNGMEGIFLGMESGSDRVIKRAKGISVKNALDTVMLLKAAGVSKIVASFIIGHPWDDEETLKETLKFALRLQDLGVLISVSLLVPYPGSAIGDFPAKFGVSILSKDYRLYTGEHVLLNTKNLTPERIFELYLDFLDKLTA